MSPVYLDLRRCPLQGQRGEHAGLGTQSQQSALALATGLLTKEPTAAF